MVLPWFDADSFVRPRNLSDAPTLVFIGSPLNGEKSPTMGKDLQFCRLIVNGFTGVEDLTAAPKMMAFLPHQRVGGAFDFEAVQAAIDDSDIDFGPWHAQGRVRR